MIKKTISISPSQLSAYTHLLTVVERQLKNFRKLKIVDSREQELLHDQIIGSLQAAIENCRLTQ